MSTTAESPENIAVETLEEIARRNQVWTVMADKYGVENPAPPWKTKLDGMRDAIDRSGAAEDLNLTFTDRRDEEDGLSASRYAELPYPEIPLVALPHSLVARGVIGEEELRRRLDAVRTRLEA